MLERESRTRWEPKSGCITVAPARNYKKTQVDIHYSCRLWRAMRRATNTQMLSTRTFTARFLTIQTLLAMCSIQMDQQRWSRIRMRRYSSCVESCLLLVFIRQTSGTANHSTFWRDSCSWFWTRKRHSGCWSLLCTTSFRKTCLILPWRVPISNRQCSWWWSTKRCLVFGPRLAIRNAFGDASKMRNCLPSPWWPVIGFWRSISTFFLWKQCYESGIAFLCK